VARFDRVDSGLKALATMAVAAVTTWQDAENLTTLESR